MKIHQLTAAEALRSLQSGRAGLSADQAGRRLVEFGPNQVVRARRKSILWQLSKEFIHFFALILWLAAGLAFWAHFTDPGQGMATLGFAIVGVIIVTVVTGTGQAVVCATGDHTEFGKIAHLTQTIRHATFPVQRDIAFLSRVLALLAAALGIVFFSDRADDSSFLHT